MRQLFDDQARDQHKRHGSRHSSHVYADAKRSSIDENIFGPSSLASLGAMPPVARNLEFERVKQKFDRPTTSSSSRNPKKTRNFSSFLKFNNKRSDPSPVDAYNSPRNSQYLEIDMKSNENESLSARKKNDAFMHSSINIDGFKVSEAEDDDDVRSKSFV